MPKIALRAALMLTGFTAVVAQIVLMRELIVCFQGNEVTLGLMLAVWLLWTAVGSAALGRLPGRVIRARRVAALLFALAAAAFPATIFAVRASRQVFQSAPGEALGPGAVLLTCLVTLSAFCAVSGGLFAAASRLYAEEAGAGAAESTGAVYLLEAAGSGLGGILVSLALVRWLGAFDIAFTIALLDVAAAAMLAFARRRTQIAAAAVGAGIVAFLLFSAAPRLERASVERLWRGFRVAGTENSIYGNLAVIAGEGSGTIYENGVAVATVPDPAAAEEAVHYALLQHPAPHRMLLIGGGVNGSLAQALQHGSLERIDYVELDPALTGIAQRYFPREWDPLAADPRVHIHPIDGRLFLKTTGRTFDVIIINLPDPQTAQLNRFYTFEFAREAARKLTASGVLSFQLRSSENYISPELAAFLRSVHKTLAAVYPEVSAMPGETVHFFAAKRRGVLARGADDLIARLRARNLKTQYVRDWAVRFRMMPDRIRDLEAHMRPDKNTPLNHDFAPIAYYFNTTLWATQFNSGYRRFFDAIAHVRFGAIAAGLLVLLSAAVVLLRRVPDKRLRLRATAAFSAGSIGFAMMGLEILLLLGFQAVYGYVYHQLAVLTATFMAGMALGTWRGLRAPAGLRTLSRMQIVAAAAPLAVCGFLASLAALTGISTLPLVSQVLFPAVAAACGAIGGYQFAVASRLYFAAGKQNPSLGALYAIDLAGACAGALALSTYLIPLYGFLKTACLIAAVCLAPAFIFTAEAQRRREKSI